MIRGCQQPRACDPRRGHVGRRHGVRDLGQPEDLPARLAAASLAAERRVDLVMEPAERAGDRNRLGTARRAGLARDGRRPRSPASATAPGAASSRGPVAASPAGRRSRDKSASAVPACSARPRACRSGTRAHNAYNGHACPRANRVVSATSRNRGRPRRSSWASPAKCGMLEPSPRPLRSATIAGGRASPINYRSGGSLASRRDARLRGRQACRRGCPRRPRPGASRGPGPGSGGPAPSRPPGPGRPGSASASRLAVESESERQDLLLPRPERRR